MLRAEDKSITMASNCRSFEFTAAIRGFHIYQKVWQPELNDTLVCIHERGNEFDAFSVKTVLMIMLLLDVYQEKSPAQQSIYLTEER